MTTIRRGPTAADNFTIISNSQIRDSRLTWEARGLLAWLQSHSEGYDVTEEAMIAAGSYRRDGVRRMVRELEDAGYLRRKRTYEVTGGSAVEYVLLDPRATAKAAVGEDASGGVQDDQAKRDTAEDVSAGQDGSSPGDGQSGGRSTTEDQKKNTKTTSSSLRATRLPDNFQPTEQMRAWFAAENLSASIDGRIEHDKFCDYWAGAPGAKGRKVDWPATWRNWMRTAAERAGRRPGSAIALSGSQPGQKYFPSTTDAKLAQTAALAEKFRQMEEN